jgi:hypothetical protein
LLQFSDNPGTFFLHRRIYFPQCDPIGSAHDQAISTHLKSDAFAPRSLKPIRNMHILK